MASESFIHGLLLFLGLFPLHAPVEVAVANFKLALPSFLPLWSFPVPTHNSLSYESDHSGRVRDQPGLPVPEASLIWDFWM